MIVVGIGSLIKIGPVLALMIADSVILTSDIIFSIAIRSVTMDITTIVIQRIY